MDGQEMGECSVFVRCGARSARRDIYRRLIYIGADGRGAGEYIDGQREQGGAVFFGRVLQGWGVIC